MPIDRSGRAPQKDIIQHNFIANAGIRLYLRREQDNRISGLLQREESGTMGYFAGLDNLLLYLERLCSGDGTAGGTDRDRLLEYRGNDSRILTAQIDRNDFKSMELNVTGNGDNSLRGVLRMTAENPGCTYSFESELELLRILCHVV